MDEPEQTSFVYTHTSIIPQPVRNRRRLVRCASWRLAYEHDTNFKLNYFRHSLSTTLPMPLPLSLPMSLSASFVASTSSNSSSSRSSSSSRRILHIIHTGWAKVFAYKFRTQMGEMPIGRHEFERCWAEPERDSGFFLRLRHNSPATYGYGNIVCSHTKESFDHFDFHRTNGTRGCESNRARLCDSIYVCHDMNTHTHNSIR